MSDELGDTVRQDQLERPGPMRSTVDARRLSCAIRELHRRIDRAAAAPKGPDWRVYGHREVLWAVSSHGALELHAQDFKLVAKVPQVAVEMRGREGLDAITRRLWSMRDMLKRLSRERRRSLEPFATLFNA